MKEQITWVVNEHGDIQVYRGDFYLKELSKRKYDMYVDNNYIGAFFLAVNLNGYRWEPGDWDVAWVHWEDLERKFA